MRNTGRHLLLVVLAVAVLAASSMGLAGRAEASPASDAADAQTLFTLTNQARAAGGLAALAPDPAANAVAQGWAQYLLQAQALSHNPNLAAQITNNVTSAWTRIGENVGYGPTVGAIQNAFLNSPGHYANIMGDYNRVGIGAVRDGNGLLWLVLDFVKGPALPTVDPAIFRPFGNAPQMVAQQYVDLLGRQADSDGLSVWSNMLNFGQLTPGQLVSNFMTSPEFGSLVSPVSRLYLAAFHRSADYGGLTYWVNAERTGTPLRNIASYVATSPEFVSMYGNLDLVGFITRLYQNVLGRLPDAGGLSYWLSALQRGLSKGDVLLGFSDSAEYQGQTAPIVNATLGYIGMLRRSPDASGLSYWSGQLRAGVPLSSFAAALLGSAEYAHRF